MGRELLRIGCAYGEGHALKTRAPYRGGACGQCRRAVGLPDDWLLLMARIGHQLRPRMRNVQAFGAGRSKLDQDPTSPVAPPARLVKKCARSLAYGAIEGFEQRGLTSSSTANALRMIDIHRQCPQNVRPVRGP